MLFYVPMAITVAANIAYHLCQKGIRPNSNPLVSLLATYIVALICTAVALPFVTSGSITEEIKLLGPASYFLGIAAAGLEIGFLLVYRSGWNISISALYSNLAVTVVLIPVGLLFFREKLNSANVLGLVLAIAGLILMGRK